MAQISQNDRYEITLLNLSVYRIGEGPQDIEFIANIEVIDLTENKKYSADVAMQTIKEQKNTLNSHKQDKITTRELLIANLQAINRYTKDWSVKKHGQNAYSISGQGLGWTDGKLANGTWDFRTDTGQMMPTDKEGLALFYFITSP